MSLQPRILVVEDDRALNLTIEICLKRNGYRVMLASDGEMGFELARSEQPDLVVLDVMLPRANGVEVCQRLRQIHFEAPILMLTGKVELEDRVNGLNAGADDYLAKPFEPKELLARINALLRRFRRTEERRTEIELGDVRVDLVNKTATRAGEPLALTKTEYSLLELLARSPGKPVSRENMLDVVWGYTRFPTTRTIDTHIWRLRKKLGDDGDAPRWIKPIHGQGYCLMLENAEPGWEL
jgi:DNA-binding response OmpR family regulator